MVRPKKISDETVLEIARECFLKYGPQVSTTAIAKKIGLSQAALFKRFKTKEDLFIAAIASRDTFSRLIKTIAWLNTNPKAGPFEVQLENALHQVWGLLNDILPRVLAMHSNRALISPEKLFGNMKKPPPVKVLEAIEGFILRAQKNGQVSKERVPEVVAMNIMGSVQGRIFFTKILHGVNDTMSDDDYLYNTAKSLCLGLSPKEI